MKRSAPAPRARISNGAIVRIFNMLAEEAERIDADPRMIADTLYAIHEYMQEDCCDPANEDDTLVLGEVYEKLKAEVDRSALRSMRARMAAALRKAARQPESDNSVRTRRAACPMPSERFPTPKPRRIKLVPVSNPRKNARRKRC